MPDESAPPSQAVAESWDIRPSPRTIFWGLLVLAGVAVTSFYAQTVHLRLGDVNALTVLRLLSPFLLISLLIERALEVLVTALQGPREAELKLLLSEAKKAKRTEDIVRFERLYTRHRVLSKKLAWRAGLILGIGVALAGIRLLEAIVGEDILPDLPEAQRVGFFFVDTIVTGAAIGGGADGLHKVVSLFTDYIDVGRKRIKGEEDPAPGGASEGKPDH